MTYKAFVSSTFIDLEQHRNHIIKTLRKSGFYVDPMEDWTASKDAPKQFSQDRIDGCDLFVLIVGFRRGTIPEGEIESITQLEYKAAIDLGIDILVFMLDEAAAWPREIDELSDDVGIQKWREKLSQIKGVEFFQTEPTTIDIAPALTRWVMEKNAQKSEFEEKIISLFKEFLDKLETLRSNNQKYNNAEFRKQLRKHYASWQIEITTTYHSFLKQEEYDLVTNIGDNKLGMKNLAKSSEVMDIRKAVIEITAAVVRRKSKEPGKLPTNDNDEINRIKQTYLKKISSIHNEFALKRDEFLRLRDAEKVLQVERERSTKTKEAIEHYAIDMAGVLSTKYFLTKKQENILRSLIELGISWREEFEIIWHTNEISDILEYEGNPPQISKSDLRALVEKELLVCQFINENQAIVNLVFTP